MSSNPVRGRVAQMLKEEFLSGALIQSKDFAEKHGVAKSSVNEILRHMSHLIEVVGKVGAAANAPLYKCRDLEAMRDWKPRASKPRAVRRAENAMRMAERSTLAQVWGIAAADVADLPKLVHTHSEDEAPDNPGNTFGSRMRFARIERGMTQEQFADRTGLERTMINKYEQDVRQPAMDNLVAIVQTLDCTADWLLGLED